MTTSPLRSATLVSVLTATLLVLTACGGSSNNDSADPATEAGAGVTVDTSFGEVTVPEDPQKIVVIGADLVDMLVSLDEQPVAFAGSGEQSEEALIEASPWLDGIYTGEFDPALVTAEYKVSAEAVANHDPDLIIGRPYYIEEQQYQQLSAIAPTVVLEYASADRDWTDDLNELGRITGNDDKAVEAQANVDAEFASAREELPGLDGKTFNSGFVADTEGIYVAGDYSWVENLGLIPAENQPKPGEFRVTLPRENIDQFAGDVVLINAEGEYRELLDSDPRVAQWPSIRNGTAVFADRATLDAGTSIGPASLTWVLPRLVPQLKDSALNNAGR